MRLRRICSQDDDFKVRSEEYIEYLIQCGHDRDHIRSIFQEVSNMTRQEARKSKAKQDSKFCVFCVKYNPRAPDIGKIVKKHLAIIDSEVVARKILPATSIRVAYKRNANLKELLAPSNSNKDEIEGDGLGCFKCEARRCDCCENFFISGSRFRSAATGKEFKN